MSNNGKKSIAELKQDPKTKKLDKASMNAYAGGKRRGYWLRQVCGGIMPQ